MKSLSAPGSTIARIARYTLPTLTFVLGLQLIDTFVSSVSWYLRDVKLVGTFGLLPYAFAPFVLALFAGFLRRALGPRLSLWVTSGGVAVVRLAEQVSRNSEIDLWLSITGLALFLMLIPLFIGHARSLGSHNSHRWVFGFVLGFAIELSLRALYNFRPLNSIDGVLPAVIVAILSLAVLIAIWREPFHSSEFDSDVSWGSALSLVVFGPLIVLQVLLFGSPGYLGEVASLTPSLSFAVVMLGYLSACAGIYFGFTNPHALHPLIALLFTAFLALSSYYAANSGLYLILSLLLAQGYAGFGLALVGIANSKGIHRGLFRTILMSGFGMILFLIMVFGFYIAQEIPLPFQRSIFPATAGVLVGLLILQATMLVRSRAVTTARYLAAPAAAVVLLLVPLIHWIFSGSSPEWAHTDGGGVRVMTYNIHSGFNTDGQPDLEAIAQVIESSDADIVGLQEVSRWRFMDASSDVPYWLARRLGMAYVFQGTEEPIWGNALLSRYPIIEWGWGDLPRAGKLIGRGYLWARIDVGEVEPVLVIVTHLHHLAPDSHARQVQIPEILQFWGGQAYSVLLGDMNAEPGSAEMEMISAEGFKDAWTEVGEGVGYTFSSDDPVKRIDWLWHSDDLVPAEIGVIQTQASDHMPVQAFFLAR